VGIEAAGRRRFFVNDLEHHRSRIAGEGFPPRQHGENNNAQREDVRAGVKFAALHLFGGHIGRRSHDPYGAGHTFTRQDFGDPKIRDFGAPILSHQDVGGFQIAVDHLVPMRVIKRLGHLPHDIKGLVVGQGDARFENFLQGLTRDHFHYDATGLAFLIIEGVVNGDDGGVRQAAGRPDFAHEHFLRAVASFLRRRAEGDYLQGHLAADGGVGSFVDHPHRAPAQLGNDVVPSDFLHGASLR
jgi:hypothetical protein